MARSVWNGSLTVSLLNLPIKLGGASDSDKIELHQVRESDGSRIKMKRTSAADGEEVAYADVRKAYIADDGTPVVITPEDFEEAYGEVSKNAEIVTVTDEVNVPVIAREKPYFVMPDKGGEKVYALLAAALKHAGKVAVVSFAMRERKRLAVLSATDDGYLMLQQLTWAQDIRRPDFPAPAAMYTPEELEMAAGLLATMTGDYDHEAQRDDSQEKLRAIVERKLNGGNKPAPKPVVRGDEAVTDLMTTLRTAVEHQKAKKEKV
jgi:DNA end-binding protein Ku